MLQLPGEGAVSNKTTEDKEGNIWYKEGWWAQRINQGVRGAHVVMPFQYEDCWMVNLEGRYPVPRSNDAYAMCLRQANLDAMGSRAISTIGSHAAAVKRTVTICTLIR